MANIKAPLLLSYCLSLVVLSVSSSDEHFYNVGNRIPLFVNKVGPVHNPSETYQFYDLPFCHPEPVIWKKESLGEVLNGDRLASSLFDLRFRQPKNGAILCQKNLAVGEVSKFRNAVMSDFYYQLYYDDLPIWGYVGKSENTSWMSVPAGHRYYLFTHIQFDALYNGNQVIGISAFSHPNYYVDVTDDVEVDVEFTYSVSWNATSTRFEDRMNKYSRASNISQHQKIHWFSVINSFVILALSTGLLVVLLSRHIKNDIRQPSAGDEEEDGDILTNSHNYVLRVPSRISLFCAVVGSGMQLLTTVCCLFLLAFLNVLYPYKRGTLYTALVLTYSLGSMVGGYTSVSLYCQFAERGWEWTVLATGIVFLGPSSIILFALNTVSMTYGATAALPFGTILIILLIYAFVVVPLLILGGILGRIFRSEFRALASTRRNTRELPWSVWYRKVPCQVLLGGLLSFISVVLELYELCLTLWGFKITVLPGTLFVTFFVLVTLTAVLGIILTLVQLSSEDPDWWWRSFFRGGSAAIFMFGYFVCYYARSDMSGFLQLSMFLGYSACMCYALFVLLGTVGFVASLIFVRHFYQAVKSE
ncbi:hypothetical protein MLD38_017234 [Melastoma candidum]|uniref:Uncharacterized protein n=1 Tax=Melastoma candidum TaxID=119954 RepID=A0ACB9QY65_9MYRT|nr:hypothetical protein MLD38_017234 [Melastoma candidum]